MKHLRNKRLLILLFGIIILLGLIGYSLSDRENISAPEQFIHDIVLGAHKIIYKPIQYTSDLISNVSELKDTYKENQLLKSKITEYKTLVYEIQDLKKDNEQLKKTLNKTESLRDFHPIQASVTSRSPEKWIEQVMINKGAKHGIKPNMAVITADGMLGKVLSTSQYTATVQLLTGFDEFNRISASISKDKDKDIFGLVEQYDNETNSLFFRIIDDSNKDVQKGDVVVSSGMGGVFPEGLLIGTVKKVIPDQYGLTSTALIQPAADMYSIDHVIIVERVLTEDKDDE